MVDQILDRVKISSSILEIFTSEVWSRSKSGKILHIFGHKNFWGGRLPKNLDLHYKI